MRLSTDLTSDELPVPMYETTYSVDSRRGVAIRTIRFGDKFQYESKSEVPLPPNNEEYPEWVSLSSRSKFELGWLLAEEISNPNSKRKKIRIVDLFSGAGGLTCGIVESCRALGLETEVVMAWDVLEYAKSVYCNNFDLNEDKFKMNPIQDIFKIEIESEITKQELEFKEKLGPINIVVGGPPCQGNSDLNNHTRRTDPKNDLYLCMARFIKVISPELAIIENVQAVRASKSNVVQSTVGFLKGLGYRCDEGSLRSMDYGVAQDRRRHFTIASKVGQVNFNTLNDDRHKIKRINDGKGGRPVLWAIADLIDVLDKEDAFNYPATHNKTNQGRIDWLFGETDWTPEEKKKFNRNKNPKGKPYAYELPAHLRPRCHQEGQPSYNKYPAVYGRMYPDVPSPTITCGFGSCGQGRFVHPKRRRSLTPHEAARVQSFPDHFSFKEAPKRVQLQTLIGNAVPPMLATHIGIYLMVPLVCSDPEFR